MKHTYILALLALSFVLALSSSTPDHLSLRTPPSLSERLRKFHEKMSHHLANMERKPAQESEIPEWRIKRAQLKQANYDSEEALPRGFGTFRRPTYESLMANRRPSYPEHGRRWLSPNAEMYKNHFSRSNSRVSPFNQIQHQTESLEEKINRIEKKLNELKRTQKYQAALERVIERLAKKHSQ